MKLSDKNNKIRKSNIDDRNISKDFSEIFDISENFEDIGKSSIQLEKLSDVYLNSFCKGFRLTDEEVDPHYLNFQLNSTYLRDEISIEANGFTRINLRLENLENTKILLPTLSEQKEIVNILREKYLTLKNLLNLVEQYSNLLEIYKKSLIQTKVSENLLQGTKT